MLKKIVVGADGSEAAQNALRLACDLAGKYGSEIHLAHTPEVTSASFVVGGVAGYHALDSFPSAEEIRAASDRIVSEAVEIAKSCGADITKTHIGKGNPADQILSCAEGCGADLIVTGRRGLGNVSGLLMGSTSQRIGHLAKCAHLSVA